MRIYDLFDDNGALHAFEISNGLVGRYGACRIAGAIPGVKLLETYRPFRSPADVFCVFTLNGRRFEIIEPYGDNSRYVITPSVKGGCPETHIVRDHFEKYDPYPRTFAWLGGIILFVAIVFWLNSLLR